jgi:hypothetical protein
MQTAMYNVFYLLKINVKKEGTYVKHIHGNQAEWYYSMSICKNKNQSIPKVVVTELYKSFS